MKFKLAGESVEIEGATPASIAALRLVQYHAPKMLVIVNAPSGRIEARLGDLDLAPSFKQAEPINQDRAQLAKLGG